MAPIVREAFRRRVLNSSSNHLETREPSCEHSLVEAHFFLQLDKARLGTQRIVDLVDLEKEHPLRADLVSPLQSVQGPLLVAETEVNYRGAEWRDESLRRHLIQLSEDRPSLIAVTRLRIGIAEPCGDEGRRIHSLGSFQFRDPIVEFTRIEIGPR